MEEIYIYLCENNSKIRNVLYIGWVNIFNQILSREQLQNEEEKRYITYCIEWVNIVYKIASWGQLHNEEVKRYIMYCLEQVNIFNRIVSWKWLHNEEVKRYRIVTFFLWSPSIDIVSINELTLILLLASMTSNLMCTNHYKKCPLIITRGHLTFFVVAKS